MQFRQDFTRWSFARCPILHSRCCESFITSLENGQSLRGSFATMREEQHEYRIDYSCRGFKSHHNSWSRHLWWRSERSILPNWRSGMRSKRLRSCWLRSAGMRGSWSRKVWLSQRSRCGAPILTAIWAHLSDMECTAGICDAV